MKRNTFLFVLLAILVVQPLIVANLGVLSPGMAAPESDGVFNPALGTRLTPEEHSNHVPILITGNDDFVSQGWPGSGTSGDPYLISGLNITYANGMISISITNTTVYFVIRDCYIDQGSSVFAIDFNNASNGVIEHCTLNSFGGGINLSHANSTTILNTGVFCTGDYALSVDSSRDCFVANSEFENPGGDCSYWRDSPSPTLNYNSWYSDYYDNNILVLEACNDTEINHSTFTNGWYGIMMTDSYDPQITNVTITQSTYGMQFLSCGAVSIADSYSESPETTLYMNNCNDSSVVDSEFVCDDNGDYAIGIYNSHRFTFTGNTLSDAEAYGIVVNNCEESVVNYNTFLECEPVGIHLSDSPDSEVIGNIVERSDGSGIELYTSPRSVVDYNEITYNEGCIYAQSSINTTFIGNTLRDCGYGIYLETMAYNATISENQISDADTGIYVQNGEWCQINDNVISDVGYGLYLTGGEDLDVYSNIISFANNDGIYFQDLDDTHIHHNTITDSNDGIYESGSCDRIRVEDNTLDSIVKGITIRGTNSSIVNNDITNVEVFGVRLSSVVNCEIRGNTISGAPVFGVMSYQDINISLIDNVFTDCGFIFEYLGGAIDIYNHTISGNTVNGLPIYYGITENGGSVNLASYGQVILLNCSYMEIIGASIGQVTVPVQILYSHNITISDIVSPPNVRTINVYETDNVTISDITSIGRASQWEYSDAAIYLRNCDNVTIENVDTSESYYGIYMYYADFVSIESSTFDNGRRGIYGSTSCENVTVDYCDVTNMQYQGIYGGSNYWTITNCYVYNVSYAIYNNGGSGWYIGDNTLEHSWNGIRAINSGSTNGVIHHNEITNHRDYGIYISSGDNWDILNNTILWNGLYGIYLTGSSGTEVYYNMIGISGTENAYDSISQNWDDGVDTGNWWSDYSGTGVYNTVGSGVDNYPMKFPAAAPIINEPWDLSYAEGDEGNELTWIVYDDYLSHYSVSIDGSVWAATSCPDLILSEIIVDVDGLAYGDHAVTITVWDIEDNTVSHSLTIHVFDDAPPDIDTPPNVEVFVGGDGQSITWMAYDLNPGTYTVMMDETEFATGSWTNGEITIDIDGLTAGVHSFLMYVYDADENSVFDGVDVLVIDDAVAPTIDSPDDIVFVVGTTSNRIIWTPVDEYPATYEVSENSSIFIAGEWGGSRVILDIDNLVVGEYTFTLTVFDGSGNLVADEVNVKVIPFEGWTPEAELMDSGLLIIGVAAAGGVIAVVVIVYFLKIKKPNVGGA